MKRSTRVLENEIEQGSVWVQHKYSCILVQHFPTQSEPVETHNRSAFALPVYFLFAVNGIHYWRGVGAT